MNIFVGSTKIGSGGTSTANPKTVTLSFTAGVTYTAKVWAVSGAGQFVLSATETYTPQPEPEPATGPNVVVINTDDQRADTLEFLPKIRQWMSAGGTTFRNGYASIPSCCPSRATLMSGRYVHNNGQYGQQNQGLDLTLTLQRYMQDGGYYTGHAGKFIHWLPLDTVAPHWNRWTYFRGGYYDVPTNQDGKYVRSSGNSTVLTFTKAIDYVDDFAVRDAARPWYLHLAPIAPHGPSTPEPQYADAAVPPFSPDPSVDEADRSDKPPFVRSRNNTTETQALTRTKMIQTLYTLDDQVDRLLSHLERTGELGNTLVIFTSDNGYMWGEHKLSSKFLPYRKSVEVPFLIRWPDHVAANATKDDFVTHVDIAPTVLAAAGITQDHVQFDGRDILSSPPRTHALFEYYYDDANGNKFPNWASIRSSAYQYTEYYTIGAPTTVSFREYYDMEADPYQLNNLLGNAPTSDDPDVAALSTQLKRSRECVGSTCP